MAKTEICGKEYIDMEDIKCPKCESVDFNWVNVGCSPNGDTWACTCEECGHKFKVIEESFFQVEDEE